MSIMDYTIATFRKKTTRYAHHTRPDGEELHDAILEGDTYRICRLGSTRYRFLPHDEPTLNTVVVYDVENNIDRSDYTKKEILGLLKYLRDHQIAVGFEAELWLTKETK